MKFFLTLFAIVFFWGLWGFFNKLAVNKINLQAGFWNALIILLSISIFLLFSGQFFPLKFDISGISFSLLAGISSAVASILFYIFLSINPAGIVIAATALYPLVTLLLSVLFLQEKITFIKFFGIAFSVLGLYFLSL